jgi:signal transduction histidine kinase/FixJ family two-component response regulator
MDDLPRSLKWLTRVVRGACVVTAAVTLVGTPIFWSLPELVRLSAPAISGLNERSIVIDQRAQWLGFCASLPSLFVLSYGLWRLWRLFGEYQAGRFFAIATQGHLRGFAWALLGSALLTPVTYTLMSIALSAGMPPGQQMLSVSVGTDLFLELVAGIAMLAIAFVLTQASRLSELNRELEVASLAKTRLLAAASHDLRQPVVSVSLLTELLREQPLPPTAAPLVDRIGKSVRALNDLLKGLLDLSRFEAGVVRAQESVFALHPLLQRVLGDEAESARRKGIVLRLRAAPFSVRSDRTLVEQVLRNLVGNAVRYTRRGGVLLSARRHGSGHVLIQVWDTGPGIPEQSRSRVFEEFVQLQTEGAGRGGGLGLGLALVRRAADVLGAPIQLRSVVGKGSCFAIELPWAGLAADAGDAASVADTGLQGRRVWIVEDDPGGREALCMRLAGWGAVVRDFGDVQSVRSGLAEQAPFLPQLLLTDLRLPDGTGIDVVRLLRSADAALPVLVITGDTAPGDIALVHSSDLPVLHKPFTSEGLLAAIKALDIATQATAAAGPHHPRAEDATRA